MVTPVIFRYLPIYHRKSEILGYLGIKSPPAEPNYPYGDVEYVQIWINVFASHFICYIYVKFQLPLGFSTSFAWDPSSYLGPHFYLRFMGASSPY